MHLADAFIQSDSGQAIHFCQYVCSLGIEPTTFALLRDGGIFLQNNNDFLCQH